MAEKTPGFSSQGKKMGSGRLRAAEYHEARIPVRRLTDLWPSPGRVTAAVDALAGGNPTAIELFCLGAIARASGARHIFEIGTFDGATTLQLALNTAPDALIYTLDLPAEDVDRTRNPLLPHEPAYALKPASGSRFRGTPVQDKIRQLYGDSAAFSAEAFAGRMDLVFVDGSHAREYVRSDSALARVLARPGGWIVWHRLGHGNGPRSASTRCAIAFCKWYKFGQCPIPSTAVRTRFIQIRWLAFDSHGEPSSLARRFQAFAAPLRVLNSRDVAPQPRHLT